MPSLDLRTWIRTERELVGMLQRDVSKVVGTDSGTISRWERGRGGPTLEQFRAMCIAFEASADEALGLPERPRRRARR